MKNLSIHLIGAFVVLILMHGKIYSQELQTSLFQEVNQSMQTANHAQADVLSPRTYNKAMDEYNAAQKKYADAGDLSDIRSHIYTANSKFQEATENTKVSSVMFTNALSARRDAISAVAVLYAKNIWEDAEKKMKDAAEELEKGDADDAKEEAVKATDLYRKAELESIKANYLSNAKNLLKKVDDDKVYKVSPKTSKQAQSLVNEVEKELIENRYDTDNARYLAKEAEYQAKLAMYIAKQEKIMDKQDFSHEDYLLLSYEPIAQIGESFQLNLRFDQGVDGPVSQIKGRIGADQQRIAILEASLYNEKVKSSNLQGILKEQEIILADLEGTLSDEALKGQKRQAILQNRIDRQNEINAKFEQVQQIFTADEAQVFRQKDYVIIRMIGINFEVGKSQIKEEDYNQLTKLQKAMSLFLNASIVIEGHTDSQGGDTDNLKLSQERADAVLSYLSANTTINKGRFSTRGFGESKPVANNETLGGRKLNRRIDIIIIPNLNTMMPGTVAPSIN